MKTPSLIRLLRLGASVVLVLVSGVGLAGAQCTITGPSQLCSGSAELCGPDGPYFYDWRDLLGNPLGDQRCLIVTAPGTYQLTTFDFINGLSAGPCEQVVAAGETGSCTVTGPSSACQGTGAELCGPDGMGEYRWSGPASFSASTACVEVSAAGTYELRTRNAPDACWSNPCVKTVSFERCGGHDNCPVAPWLWQRQCWSSDFPDRRLFSPEQMAQVGKCADERSASFAWKDSQEGLCRTLRYRYNLRDRARRQFAGVLANVCAHDLGLTPRQGPARGLDPETPLQLEGFSGTIAAWLSSVDARLGELERKSLLDRWAKEGYRRIICAGWQINHGLGMGPVCAKGRVVPMETALGAASRATEDETLAEELRDPDQPLSLEGMQPNPTSGQASIAYVLSGATADEVFVGIYDVSGRLVRELDRGFRTPGRHVAVWDGRDADGRVMRNGAYFVMGRVGAQRIQGRLVVLRK